MSSLTPEISASELQIVEIRMTSLERRAFSEADQGDLEYI
jgi:hypothetical protein